MTASPVPPLTDMQVRSRTLGPLLSRLAFTPHAIASTSTASAPRRRRTRVESTNVDLVAPPDPSSNIRPIIYASSSVRKQTSTSPYSTGEFPYAEAEARLEDLELEWRLSRERTDMTNHRFWAAVNTEFNAQLDHRLSRLPTPSDPPTAEDGRRRDECLGQFYADWQAANRVRQARWVREWWREIWAGLKMQWRVYIARGWRKRGW
ncbi:MAG: hypothetical protein TREMPRED_000623 [Tremellales sp. Tagirdzhanova-0007]|nr:MAG: hypothetical protein TREMPRED_000623 [Tremellales sp. Tagirdzhanova-0007]